MSANYRTEQDCWVLPVVWKRLEMASELEDVRDTRRGWVVDTVVFDCSPEEEDGEDDEDDEA